MLLAISVLPYSVNVSAEERLFLTIEELLDHGYTQLTGQQLGELLQQKKIELRDIETEAVSLSRQVNSSESGTASRQSEDVKSGSAMYFLDTRLLARAPFLEGEPKYTVSGDELIATDGVRTYHIRFYEKQGKMYGVRDIDNGYVFFEVIIK